MKKSIVILICCISLASCIHIESDITLNNDGSGVVTLTYGVSPVMNELGRIGDEVKPFPFPIYKEDFETLMVLHPGLSLKSHSVKKVDGETRIKAVFSFRTIEALDPLGGAGENAFFYQKSDEYTVFRQELPFGGDEELDEDMIAMLKEYCSDYYFIYSIHTPRPIKEYTLGELSKNKKHLVYKTEIIDVLQSTERQQIEVKW
jgi:hypothetical protein